MSDAHTNNRTERAALGLVTHDNTGGPFVVECQGCGAVYPSFQCGGGGQIADTGDYDDSYCPRCEQVDPDECNNVGLAWNTQQLNINALQVRLCASEQRVDDAIELLSRILESQASALIELTANDIRAFVNHSAARQEPA